MTHYYPKLGEILRGTNGGSKVVLNQHFVDWQERIEDHLKFRRRDKRYYHDDDNETALFRYAQEHQDHYGKALSGQEALVLIHPLYLPLSHPYLLKEKKHQTEAEDYLHTLLQFLQKRKQKEDKDVGVILFDTLYHYTAASSLLLEQGLVDVVLFTLYDEGALYRNEDIHSLNRKTVFAGGAYNGKCFSAGIGALWGVVDKSSLWTIPEIILDSPQKLSASQSLRANWINCKRYGYPIPHEQEISLEQLAQRWGI
ncbi:hypothetical protein J4210_05410 [Candidatus Woesearchaeota archaeon]|nr:hypothetical protein [Candidatus Woesearchaeota archaeon]